MSEQVSEQTGEQRGIGWAVKQLQDGALVRRAGWNGKGMFLYLVPGTTFTVNRKPLNDIYPPGTEITYRPHVDIRGADGACCPWLCSQADLLATDWELAVFSIGVRNLPSDNWFGAR